MVTLIAARAGCQVMEYPVDRNSRDIMISPISGQPVNIDAQLKSTVNLIDSGLTVKYDLSKKNYDELRATEVATAQILIVVDLHNLQDRWVRQSSRHLIFDKCAYWVSLYDAPAKQNKTPQPSGLKFLKFKCLRPKRWSNFLKGDCSAFKLETAAYDG